MKTDTLINAVRKLETRALTRNLTAKEERQLSNFCEEAWDRMLYKPSNEIYGTSRIIGKHRLPRYLYHITTEDAYKSILESGKIVPSQCMDSPAGIFLFDIKNFTRYWRETIDIAEQPRTTLLDMVANKSQFGDAKCNIVMLRIPTKNLDARTMRLRRQKLCRMGKGNLQKEQENFFKDPYKFSNSLKGMQYSMQGESIANVSKYNQRKEALEYIIPEEISINNIGLVGKVSVDKAALSKAADDKKDLPQIWKELTDGTPERKAFDKMF